MRVLIFRFFLSLVFGFWFFIWEMGVEGVEVAFVWL